jgi:hypothetical protein
LTTQQQSPRFLWLDPVFHARIDRGKEEPSGSDESRILLKGIPYNFFCCALYFRINDFIFILTLHEIFIFSFTKQDLPDLNRLSFFMYVFPIVKNLLTQKFFFRK